MLVADVLPELRADLVPALPSLDVEIISLILPGKIPSVKTDRL